MLDRSPYWYSRFTNVDAGSARPYRCGDRFVRGFIGHIDSAIDESTASFVTRVRERHNRDDRPDWEQCPAMSTGDVIMVINGFAVTIDRDGFAPVTVAGSDLIVDRPWIDVIAGIKVVQPEHPPMPMDEKLTWGEHGKTLPVWRPGVTRDVWRQPPPWDRPPLSLQRGNGLIYECWYNVDEAWLHYQPGDRLVWGCRDVVSWSGGPPTSEMLAEAIIDRHRDVDFDDVARGYFGLPGDVVTFGDVAMSATECGVCRVEIDPANLIVDRSYDDVRSEPHPGRTVASRAAESVAANWACATVAAAGASTKPHPQPTPWPDTDLLP